MIWLQFIISAIVLILVGVKLAHFGDIIARKTGLGGLWIGAVLLAFATSLPEVVADVSASMIDAVDLAVGDVLGSGLSNMFILAIIDLIYIRLYREPAILRKVTLSHAFTATLAILLTALTAIFIGLRLNIQVFQVGLDTFVLAIVYFLGIWFLFHEQKAAMVSIPVPETEGKEKYIKRRRSVRQALVGVAIGALVIVIAAPYMVSSAQRISVATGLGATFFGTLFLAAVTSFPELVVSISALQIGAFDLAVGNLFGSNAFNILVLFLADIAYRRGAILSAISSAHIVTGLFLLLLMGIGMAGIIFRARKRYFLLIPDSSLIIIAYIICMYLLFLLSTRG